MGEEKETIYEQLEALKPKQRERCPTCNECTWHYAKIKSGYFERKAELIAERDAAKAERKAQRGAAKKAKPTKKAKKGKGKAEG